ncbi:hypothetical protein WJX75_006055 [Coccomyxa subellipsoidea]|uniref:mRNA-decapping enzyme-like protein n=1 Tax=Coccomyxa subellipsoidea TaxID=248742 RepID=A0ABR2YD29_9CHLO
MHPLGPAHLLDPKEAQRLNLSVLKRIDSATKQVLASANHVALYDFDQEDSRWVRKDVEGSLFLVQRNVHPIYQIIILNKKSQQNYVEDVLANFQFEKSRPYLLYRNRKDEVVGIWFYEEEEADKVEALLHQILASYPGSPSAPQQEVPEQAAASHSGAAASRDDSFWDQRAPSPPSDFDPFAGRAGIATPPSALGMMTPGPPATAATPPKSPGSFLRGVNGLRDSSMMTPEQSNLAKLLANMKVSSVLMPSPASTPLPSTPHHSASTSDLQRPTLLTPKFFAARAAPSPSSTAARPNGGSSVGAPESPSETRSAADNSTSTVQRTLSDPLSASSALPEPQRQLLEDTSLSRFFPLAGLAGVGSAAKPAGNAAPSQPEPAPAQALPARKQREWLRQVIIALARSDTFLDVLAKELSDASLLP